jgi:hypothetical protein
MLMASTFLQIISRIDPVERFPSNVRHVDNVIDSVRLEEWLVAMA